MQARVISVLESISSALPAVGFVLGGPIATVYSPRATFAFAGIGVVLVVGLRGPPAGLEVAVDQAATQPGMAEDDVMVELIPAMPMRMPARGHRESPSGGRQVRKSIAMLALMGLATAAALGLASCGSGGGSEGGGKEGGTLRVTYAEPPDYLDPALSYTPGRLDGDGGHLHRPAHLRARRRRGG